MHFVPRISAVALKGVIALEMGGGTYNGDRLLEFLAGTLIPEMLPFDGSNARSVLVLDNCSIHHVASIKDLLQTAGIVTMFLPPYSPDLNPAEELFSYYLKEHDELFFSITTHY